MNIFSCWTCSHQQIACNRPLFAKMQTLHKDTCVMSQKRCEEWQLMLPTCQTIPVIPVKDVHVQATQSSPERVYEGQSCSTSSKWHLELSIVRHIYREYIHHEIWSQSWSFSWYNRLAIYSEEMGTQRLSMCIAQKRCPVLVRFWSADYYKPQGRGPFKNKIWRHRQRP